MRALFDAVLTTAIVVTIVFFVARLAPGDPIELQFHDSVSAASQSTQKDALRKEYALDQSLPTQFGIYLSHLARLDFGVSIAKQKRVTELLRESFPKTLRLALAATLLATLFALTSGLLSVKLSEKRIGKILDQASFLFVTVPSFWLGPLLIQAFSLHWPWLAPNGLLLPSFCVALIAAAYLHQVLTTSLRENLRSDFVRAAYARGASDWQVLLKHILPNSLSEFFPSVALTLGHILGGATVVESIFDWNGMGTLAYEAILSRDYPVIQAVVLVTTVIFVLLNSTAKALNRYYLLRAYGRAA